MDIKAAIDTFVEHVRHAVITPGQFALVPNRGQKAVIVVKDGYKLLPVEQQRPEVPGRRYTFIDVESFTSFLLRSAGTGGDFVAVCTEVAGTNGTLTAISDVAHERHEVSLKLAEDDAWRTWQAHNNRVFTVAELRRLLKARRGDLADSSKSRMASLGDIAVNISSGAEVKLDPKTNLVTYKGQSKNVEVTGSVPESFTLAIPVYVGQGVREVVIDLEPSIDGKAEDAEQRLKLKLSIVDAATVTREAWEERVAKVRELLGDEWLVGMGQIAFERE